MKGRKPNITALPGASDKAPPAPAWLPKFARAEWARVVPALVKARSLAQHELCTVESYCLSVARIRECEAVIQKCGLTFVSPTGESKRRPETTLLKDNIEAVRHVSNVSISEVAAFIRSPRRRGRAAGAADQGVVSSRFFD